MLDVPIDRIDKIFQDFQDEDQILKNLVNPVYFLSLLRKGSNTTQISGSV
jgi:hypothetical protein